jgi:hypothetical protein
LVRHGGSVKYFADEESEQDSSVDFNLSTDATTGLWGVGLFARAAQQLAKNQAGEDRGE